MPWFKNDTSLSHEIYTIYIETIRIFLQPQITDLFDNGRKTKRAALLKKLHIALKKVYELERSKREDQPFEYENFS